MYPEGKEGQIKPCQIFFSSWIKSHIWFNFPSSLQVCLTNSGSGWQSEEVTSGNLPPMLCKLGLSSYGGSLNTNACLREALSTNNVFEKFYKRQITPLSN